MGGECYSRVMEGSGVDASGLAPLYRWSRFAPLGIVATQAVIFGLSFSLNRIGITAGIPFIAYVFWQCAGAALLLLATYGAFHHRFPRCDRRALWIYLGMSVFGMVVPYLIYAFVAPRLPAGIVGLTLATVPMFTYVFALGARLEVFLFIRLLGNLLGFAGVLLIVLPDSSLPSRDMVGWVVLALAAPASFSLSAVGIARLRIPTMGSLELAAGTLTASAILMLPIVAVTDSWWWFGAPLDAGDGALIGITLIQAAMWFTLLELIRLSGPVYLSIVDNLATLTGVGWGILFFGEVHSVWVWAALALLLVAVYLVNGTGRAVRQSGTFT